ncbi:MAG: trypsin-like peptidase domain-containing protein [Candidatus Hydrogenedentes bacterium]|nr:trypsin-like peptidase domain-containing protein [Candidatus Hydrogenedentota bacterium]
MNFGRALPVRLAQCLCFLLTLAAAALHADPGTDALDAYLQDTSVQQQLRDHGVEAIRLAWMEACPQAPGGFVYGLQVDAAGDPSPVTIYLTLDGALVAPDAYEALGLSSQAARPVALSTDTEINVPLPDSKTQEAPPALLDVLATEYLTPVLDPKAFIAALAGPEKDLFVTGGVLPLEDPIRVTGADATAGEWAPASGGRWVWTLNLVALGAKGQRIHFSSVALPEGATLLTANEARPEEVFSIPSGDDYWSPTCFSEGVVLQCMAPDAAAIPLVSLLIDKITYQFIDPIEAAREKQAGSCNNDTPCFPDWESEAKAVALWGTVNNSGNVSFLCTGSLLADLDPSTSLPFFLTANHCVSSAGAASAMEFFWFYERAQCATGDLPVRNLSPRTAGGADLLFTASDRSGTDVSLLRIRNTPPAGVSFLGFSTQPAAVSTGVVCIHHPQSDYKRISFGHLINTGSPALGGEPLQPRARFNEVLWDDGTTEGGSSGSPLLRTDTGQVIGQLYGGRASCSARPEPDYYGRFDVSFPSLCAFLNPLLSPFDLNRTCTIDAADLQLVINAALSLSGAAGTDLNDSGSVNAVDVQIMIQAILNPADA